MKPYGVLFWGAVLLAGCGGKPMIVGTVLDADGQPLAGAEARTEPPTDIRESNDKGRFYIERTLGDPPQPLPAGTYTLIVSRLPDYEEARETVVVAGETEVTVRLSEKQADVGPDVKPKPVDDRVDHTRPDTPIDGDH